MKQKTSIKLVKTKFTSQNIRYIPTHIKKTVWLRANSKCEFTRQNQRCESRHRLEIEHIRPIALGGDSKPNNLKLYCRAHNQMMAYRNLVSQCNYKQEEIN